METSTKSKINFKPILLVKDEDRMAAIIKDHKTTVVKLNDALKVGLAFIEKDIDDQEKEDLLIGGFAKAMNIIRPDFQFPKADDAFNLESIGKDPEPVKTALKSVPAWYQKDHFKVENGTVKLADNLESDLDKQCSTFTTNEKQNECYGISLGVCENLNKAHASGFIKNTDKSDIERGLNLVAWSVKDSKFIPDPIFIKQIGPDGSIRSMY